MHGPAKGKTETSGCSSSDSRGYGFSFFASFCWGVKSEFSLKRKDWPLADTIGSRCRSREQIRLINSSVEILESATNSGTASLPSSMLTTEDMEGLDAAV
ncbi:hypothetical protein QQP08_020767 [Theobroma cacao]|nr:hypothetical protein QQP08_020767 [Theobroma cacao]